MGDLHLGMEGDAEEGLRALPAKGSCEKECPPTFYAPLLENS